MCVILEIANFNILGKAGGLIRAFEFGLFGIMAYAFPVLVMVGLFFLELSKNARIAKFVCAVCIFLFTGAIVHSAGRAAYEGVSLLGYYTAGYEYSAGGGLLCGALSLGLRSAFGDIGVYIISALVIIVCLLIIFEFHRLFVKENAGGKEKAKKEKNTAKTPAYVQEEKKPSQKRGGMRTKYKEQEVYKAEEEGTVIRIVHTPESTKMKRAKTLRSENKAKPLRDENTPQTRSNAKVKGLASDLNLEKKTDPSGDVHEITNADIRPPVQKEQPKAAPLKKSVVEIRDVSEKSPLEEKASLKTQRPEKMSRLQKSAPPARSGEFCLPPLSILGKKKTKPQGAGEDIEKTSKTLEYVLEQFGVYAKVVNVQTGPSVTRYELQPEMGTRVSKFTSLADDLKLNLAVSDIRIEAPVPGKSVVGIEIPNKNVQPVTLRELLESAELAASKSKLAFAAGRSISGEVITGDISTMPHLLIAGTTGSGKSVFTKSIIMELLYRTAPEEVGLIVIDPKKVEFNVFEGIPNLMKGVVTDPGQAVSTLRWAVNEMMIRYERMNKSGVNNIKSYNSKLEKGLIEDEGARKMPQIVIVIDELADLMMAAKKEVESYICRLAQLSRAAGIHMIIATQRPSADVVTGLIRANIPSRVALKVASGIDSRIILESMGAEKLLGKGDMLFYPNGFSAPVRVQGAFVTDKEVADTVAYLKEQKNGSYYADTEKEIEEFISSSQPGPEENKEEKGGANKYDEYFHEAGLLCIEMGRASSSMLQRRFNLGFNRAARIIDQLCEFGVIGPANGSKPRDILIDSMTFEEMYEEMIKG